MLTLSLGDGAELRALEPWQADELAAHIDVVREHLRPWIPFASRVVDAASARDLLQRFADWQARDEGRMYGIWLDGQLSGGTLFKDFNAAGGVGEIGVWLAPSAEGRGLITTAVRHMIDWAINVRGLHRVEWRNAPDNERSRAVAKRLGLTYEGTLRSDFVVNGKRQDSEVWSVLADEWRGQPLP
jgi:RimJ/RimL family protein N-acetyltransferase